MAITKEEMATKPYAELQEMAKEKGLKYVGISKEGLVDSLFEKEMGAVAPEAVPGEGADAAPGEVLGDTTPYVPEEYHTQQEQAIERLAAEQEKLAAEGRVPTLTTTKNQGMPSPIKTEAIPEVKFKTKMVRIKPKKDIPKSFIGNDVWELKANKVYEVPVEVAEIFENGGYL